MKARTNIKDFRQIPNVGAATIKYLNALGLFEPFELVGQNPFTLFKELYQISGKQLLEVDSGKFTAQSW